MARLPGPAELGTAPQPAPVPQQQPQQGQGMPALASALEAILPLLHFAQQRQAQAPARR